MNGSDFLSSSGPEAHPQSVEQGAHSLGHGGQRQRRAVLLSWRRLRFISSTRAYGKPPVL